MKRSARSAELESKRAAAAHEIAARAAVVAAAAEEQRAAEAKIAAARSALRCPGAPAESIPSAARHSSSRAPCPTCAPPRTPSLCPAARTAAAGQVSGSDLWWDALWSGGTRARGGTAGAEVVVADPDGLEPPLVLGRRQPHAHPCAQGGFRSGGGAAAQTRAGVDRCSRSS